MRLAWCAPAAMACAATGAGTRNPAADSTKTSTPVVLTDDAGNDVRLTRPARRIISLVPSATETLIAIGAAPQIVGRTRYDVAPEVAGLPSVGGTVDPSIEAIIGLQPELVIAWENDEHQALRNRLVSLGIPVFVLRAEDTTDVFRGLANLGRLTAHDSAAAAVAASIHETLNDVRRAAAGRPAPSVFYVVYNDPPMTAGPRTFIGQLIALAGARSIASDSSVRWPTLAIEEILRRDPDLIMLPVNRADANPLDQLRARAGWRELRAVREGHVVTVPSDLLSRPSPSIARAARVLLAAFHPDIAPRPALAGAPR
jgi:iron complex transport system substrate-binding protein